MNVTLNQNTEFEEKLNNSIANINHINSLLKKQQKVDLLKGGSGNNRNEKTAIAAAAAGIGTAGASAAIDASVGSRQGRKLCI